MRLVAPPTDSPRERITPSWDSSSPWIILSPCTDRMSRQVAPVAMDSPLSLISGPVALRSDPRLTSEVTDRESYSATSPTAAAPEWMLSTPSMSVNPFTINEVSNRTGAIMLTDPSMEQADDIATAPWTDTLSPRLILDETDSPPLTPRSPETVVAASDPRVATPPHDKESPKVTVLCTDRSPPMDAESTIDTDE